MWFTSSIAGQIDFVYLVYGLAFFILATECLSRLRQEEAALPWGWLGWFGLVHGLYEWFDGSLVFIADSLPLRMVRLTVLAVSFLLLGEFARGGFKRLFPLRTPGPWILLFPLVMTALAVGVLKLPNVTAIRVMMGAPITLAAATVFLLVARQAGAARQRDAVPFRLAGLMLIGYAFTVCISLPAPATALTGKLPDVQFILCLGMPLLRAMFIVLLAFLIRVHFRSDLPTSGSAGEVLNWSRRWPWYVLLAVILSGGFYFTNHAASALEQERERDLLKDVELIAAGLDVSQIQQLRGVPDDTQSPAFAALRARLHYFFRLATGSRFLYLMAPHGDQLVFLADAEPADSPDYSPPGQTYTNSTAGFWRVLHDQTPLVFGPYVDRWGRWITACAPIRLSPTGDVIALLGLDTDAQSWLDNAATARRPRFYLTMLMSLLPLAGFLFIHRHRATNQLLDAEVHRFQTVFDSVNDAITIHDFNTGDILQANRRAYEMVGCKPGEVASLNLLPFRAQPEAPFDAAAAIRHLSQAAAGRPQLFEWRTRHRDGHPFWIEVSLQQVAFGAHPRIMAVVRDIDARKHAEEALRKSYDELELRVRERTAELADANTRLQEDIAARQRVEDALRESEARFRALAEADSSAIMIYQGDRILYTNPGAEKVFGYTRDELSKINCWTLVHPEHRDRVRQRGLDRLAGKKTESQYPIKIVTRSGDDRWVYASMGPITVNGQAAVVVTFLDITELRRLETEREQISQRLAQHRRLESLGAMAGGIAHDFNTLLMTVLGNADLLLAKLSPGSPTYQQAKDIHTAGRRAADISSRMLIYAGSELFNGQPLDLAASLRELHPTLAPLVGPSAELRLEAPATLPLVLGDPSMLRQMLTSLVTNAAEALGDIPGVITVRAGSLSLSGTDLNRLLLGDQLRPGEMVFLQIIDNGPGMTPEVRARLFDPFFSTKFVGRGLGLPAVFGMMRAHQGAIHVASEPGKGTTVTLHFPRHTLPPPPAT